MAISAEARLLLYTAGGREADERILDLLASGVDWGKLVTSSMAAGAQPVMWRRVREVGPTHIPAASAEALRQIERVAEFRLAYLRNRLQEAVRALDEAKIPVMLLKGAALGYTVYRSVADRPMADIDLLVEPHRVVEARAILISQAWEQRYSPEFDGWYDTMHHLPPLVDKRAPALEVGLDLHVDLLSTAGTPFRLDAEDLWREGRNVAGLPSGIRVPSDVHQLLHCCLHYAWSHRMAGVAWRTFRDVATISRVEGFDWEAFLCEAERSNGQACCYWTLRLSRSLALAAVPDEVLARLRPNLPELILRRLEHHFAHETIESEQVCPSTRLREVLWKSAIEPRGQAIASPAARPWHLLRGEIVEDERTEQLPGSARPAFRAQAWARYLRSVA